MDNNMHERSQDAEYSCEYRLIRHQSEPALFEHVSYVHRINCEKYVEDNYIVSTQQQYSAICGTPELYFIQAYKGWRLWQK